MQPAIQTVRLHVTLVSPVPQVFLRSISIKINVWLRALLACTLIPPISVRPAPKHARHVQELTLAPVALLWEVSLIFIMDGATKLAQMATLLIVVSAISVALIATHVLLLQLNA